MKILIDIGHPANVHYYKIVAKILISKGHNVFFTTHSKEFEPYLLKKLNFRFYLLGKHYKKTIGKIWGLLVKDIKLFFISLKEKPDLYLSAGSIIAAHISFLFNKPHITLEDTGNLDQIKLYKPFTNAILTPDVLNLDFGNKTIKFKAYLELLYLNSKYFQANDSFLEFLKIDKSQKFAILRFVAWNATHDVNQKGLSMPQKLEIIKLLTSHNIEVFISSEAELPDNLKQYKLDIPPEKIHDALYFAHIFIGEGATMASEAGLLGTPAVYINSISVCNNQDQEKYGTVFNFRNFEGVSSKILELITMENLKREIERRKNILISEKINITDFFVWFIENYPNSFEEMKINPEYQFQFK